MFKKKQKPENSLRRTWVGGVRKEDVDRIVAELEAELAQAAATNDALTERVSAAEGTLEAFDASLRHIGAILSLAEEHAGRIEEDARGEARRIRDDADAYAQGVGTEVEALVGRKQEALASIEKLLEGLSEVTSVPEPEAPAVPELEPVAELRPVATPTESPAPVTVADLMAMEPNLGF